MRRCNFSANLRCAPLGKEVWNWCGSVLLLQPISKKLGCTDDLLEAHGEG